MHIPVSREAKLPVIVAAVLSAATIWSVGFLPAVPVLVVLFLLLYFGRDFPRHSLEHPLGALSPIDGRVKNIHIKNDPVSDVECLCIKIAQTWHGEYILHSPVEGTITSRWWPGKDDTDAVSFGFQVTMDEGSMCVVNIVNCRRPRFKSHYIPIGQRVGQGRRCGVVGAAVECEVYFPTTATVQVVAGDRVYAGVNPLVRLKRRSTKRVYPEA